MREVNVHIGEVKIARDGVVLKTILGSCVGIALLWKQGNVCGLAHCLLPQSPEKIFTIGARFVDQAIPSLLLMMKVKQEQYSELTAVIAGGGNMTSVTGNSKSENLVGAKNFASAQALMKSLGIKILHSEAGGQEGRKMTVDSNTFAVDIKAIPRINPGSSL